MKKALKDSEAMVMELNDVVCDAFSTINRPIPLSTQQKFSSYMSVSQTRRSRQRNLESEIDRLRKTRERVGHEALSLRRSL